MITLTIKSGYISDMQTNYPADINSKLHTKLQRFEVLVHKYLMTTGPRNYEYRRYGDYDKNNPFRRPPHILHYIKSRELTQYVKFQMDTHKSPYTMNYEDTVKYFVEITKAFANNYISTISTQIDVLKAELYDYTSMTDSGKKMAEYLELLNNMQEVFDEAMTELREDLAIPSLNIKLNPKDTVKV